MFVGRKTELASLEALYASGKFELAVVSGPRRVGKTALLCELVKNKRAFFFQAAESSAKQLLDGLEERIGLDSPELPSFQTTLEQIFLLSEQQRILLVLDDYPNLVRAFKEFPHVLKLTIERFRPRSRLMLVVSGVSSAMAALFAAGGFLDKYISARFELSPFSFSEACQFFSDFSAEDKALAYGIAGGLPGHLLQLDDHLSIRENIKRAYLTPGSYLFEEPGNLLRKDVREPAVYNAILYAVAHGAARLSEIAASVGEETSACAAYVKNLVALGVLRKIIPPNTESARKAVYVIEDSMFRFWYRFVPDNISDIVLGRRDTVYERIAPHLTEYMHDVFVDICRQYLWHLNRAGKSPVPFVSLEPWRGGDVSLDLVGPADEAEALAAECVWSDDIIGAEELDAILERCALLPYKHQDIFVFAKRGFSGECREKASRHGGVTLVTVF